MFYDGPANAYDWPVDMTLDESANIYVTGYSMGAGTEEDFATVKYNRAGIEQWVARYNGTGNFSERARALALDGLGNIYVTGMTYDTSGTKYTSVKYNAFGIEQWVGHYNFRHS